MNKGRMCTTSELYQVEHRGYIPPAREACMCRQGVGSGKGAEIKSAYADMAVDTRVVRSIR